MVAQASSLPGDQCKLEACATMKIVRANAGDAPVLSMIAWAAKAHWGYPARWLETWRQQLTITPEFIATNETFAAVQGGKTIAFYALLQTTEAMRLEHLWVLPERMGQGIGRALFAHAAERAAAGGAVSLTIEADPNAEPFYLHLEAARVGLLPTEIDGHPRTLPLLHFALPKRDGGP